MNKDRMAYVSLPIQNIAEELIAAKNPNHKWVYRERLEATRDYINEVLAELDKQGKGKK